MELFWIGLAAGLTSALTLFSGFGLGTVLMPVFALFFPIPLAIAATAIVHLATNIFKFGLMAKHVDWHTVRYFSIPAALAAPIGAVLLIWVNQFPILASYTFAGSLHEITLIKSVIGVLIIIFALLELSPRIHSLTINSHWLPLGGAISGFFGGLSGNQGALRSAFLIKAGLSKEAFIATSVVSAVIVDTLRLVVYGTSFLMEHIVNLKTLVLPVIIGTGCAFIGALISKQLIQNSTLHTVQLIVAIMMILIGAGLIMGVV